MLDVLTTESDRKETENEIRLACPFARETLFGSLSDPVPPFPLPCFLIVIVIVIA